MITQCEIRKLYAQKNEPGVKEAIEAAKTLERRRCGHHPDDYPEPLSTEECMQSVVDPKGSGTNKHRYVVASQDQPVRKMLRGIKGVPLIYIKRSVMILEPMADDSVRLRTREERGKFRAEIKGALGKRKREDDDDSDDSEKSEDKKDKADENEKGAEPNTASQGDDKKKKKKNYGRKGPNPLSVQKGKKKQGQGRPQNGTEPDKNGNEQEGPAKRKRRRKAKSSAALDEGKTVADPAGVQTEASAES